jgi:S-adenosylhomocysteine hydrolase
VLLRNDVKKITSAYILNCFKFQSRYIISLRHMLGPFLKGKTAVVTGSLSGIGLGIAKALSASGANVVLNGFAP